jgi:hypothetical protein
MPSEFQTLIEGAVWPSLIGIMGETISHDPNGATAAYNATLVFDDGQAVIDQKGGRVAALISGPKANFTTAPVERDTFTRSTGSVYLCVEVDDDKIGGWLCWCRLKS